VHGPLVSEIKVLLQDFDESSVRAVRRLANEAAHSMAKQGCVNKLCKVWSRIIPDCIVNSTVSDRVLI
jgi:hypothetical protein